MSAGKGDTYRKVDGGKYRENWDRAFGSNVVLSIDGIEFTGFGKLESISYSNQEIECATKDLHGNHCNRMPEFHIFEESSGKDFYLCQMCYDNYMNKQRSKDATD